MFLQIPSFQKDIDEERWEGCLGITILQEFKQNTKIFSNIYT